tara:strand:- start:1978 stop:3123 length:1146 start_codon:yes stop_codon:yes gene_type:complete
MQKIIILGSTGSVGRSSLKIISQNKKLFDVLGLVAFSNEKLIREQSNKFKNAKTYLENPKNKNYSNKKISKEALYELISSSEVDTVIAAISGSEGLELTYHSIISGKKVLVANKEPLVMAGEFLINLAKKSNSTIIPIDSEHCSIHQSINNRDIQKVSKITLTCSGGPFNSLPKSKFKNISLRDALKHPIWKMGKKISIDSSTLMNKALEIIEAKYLFEIDQKKIDAIIHPEGIVHSLVELTDGTVLASMAKPDMKIPILYGLGFPETMNNKTNRIDIQKLSKLTFKKINKNKFPSIDFAYFAINHGQGMPIVLNAANEIAVQSFMDSEIHFEDIFKVISKTLNYAVKNNLKLKSVSLNSVLNFNNEIKEITSKNLNSFLK